MRRRWWPPAADPAPMPPIRLEPEPVVASASPRRDTGSGLLPWEVEDEALAAWRCPWCSWSQPGREDPAPLLRHVVGHARAWEAEAMHAERLRRALAGRVAGFAGEVSRLAGGLQEAP